MNDRVTAPAAGKPSGAAKPGSDPRGLNNARGLPAASSDGGEPPSGVEKDQGRLIPFEIRHRMFAELFRRELRGRKSRPGIAVTAAYYNADYLFRASERTWLGKLSDIEKVEGREMSAMERQDTAIQLQVLPPRLTAYEAEEFTRRHGEPTSARARYQNPTPAQREGGIIRTNADYAREVDIAQFERGPSNQGGGVVLGAPVYLGMHALKKAGVYDFKDETIKKVSNFATGVGNIAIDGVASRAPNVKHGKSNRPKIVDVRPNRQQRGIGPASSSVHRRSPLHPGAATKAQSSAHVSALRSLGAPARPNPVVPRGPISLATLPPDFHRRRNHLPGANDFRLMHPNDHIIVWNRERIQLKSGAVIYKGQLNKYIEVTRLPYPRHLVLEAPVTLKGSPAPGKSRSGVNAMGFKRDTSNFWKQFAKEFPGEAKLLGVKKVGSNWPAPKVTRAFANYADRVGNREDIPAGTAVASWHDYIGVSLEHHHLDNGAFVVASPKTLHKSSHGDIHLDYRVEGRPEDNRGTWKQGDGM